MKHCWNNASLVCYLSWSFIGAYSCFAANDNKLGAQLSGFDEAPPIFTTGIGLIEGTLNSESIDYTVSYFQLQGTASTVRLQFGQSGVNGRDMAFICGGGNKPLCPPAGTLTGSLTAGDIQGPEQQGIAAGGLTAVMAAIRAGTVYVNVSSDKFPAGEIRGQLRTGSFTGTAEVDNGIKGKVLLGPLCIGAKDPPDPGCLSRPYQAVVVVKTMDGLTEITRFSSDSDGDFHVSLPPGIYQLTDTRIVNYPFLRPVTVAVEPAKFINITIMFESGIQ